MGRQRPSFAYLLAASLIAACCGSPDIPDSVLDQIRRAHGQILTVDTRVDLRTGRRMSGAIAPERMRKGGLDAAIFYVPVPRARPTPEGYRSSREAALEGIARLEEALLAMSARVGQGRSSADAYRLEKEGRRAAFIGLTSGDAIGTDPSLLGAFHARGVRVLGLCDGSDNAICDSALDRNHPEDRGLSDLGRSVVAECNRLGLLIDVATCSERSILGVLAASRAPIVCTRAAARALCDAPGNLSDAAIEAIAARGGVIDVAFDPAALVPPKNSRRADVSDIADHIDHMVKRAGVESVGIGSCFGSGGGVAGCEDAGEMLAVTIELLRRGRPEWEIENVWGRNVMRVLMQVADCAGTR